MQSPEALADAQVRAQDNELNYCGFEVYGDMESIAILRELAQGSRTIEYA